MMAFYYIISNKQIVSKKNKKKIANMSLKMYAIQFIYFVKLTTYFSQNKYYLNNLLKSLLYLY